MACRGFPLNLWGVKQNRWVFRLSLGKTTIFHTQKALAFISSYLSLSSKGCYLIISCISLYLQVKKKKNSRSKRQDFNQDHGNIFNKNICVFIYTVVPYMANIIIHRHSLHTKKMAHWGLYLNWHLKLFQLWKGTIQLVTMYNITLFPTHTRAKIPFFISCRMFLANSIGKLRILHKYQCSLSALYSPIHCSAHCATFSAA